jgi:3-oxoacyl-[acyl-carrier protein] reductase
VLLSDRVAVIYGGGGAIGGAVARAFAQEGATVHLAGRTFAALQAVSASIRADGGVAEVAVVDALDERSVDEHADAVADVAGRLDISINLISHPFVQGTPLAEMAVEDYVAPVTSAVRSTFLTARAAARHMIPRGSGAILFFGGAADPPRGFQLGSLQVAMHAVEAMRRQLAAELGEHGIRTVTLLTGGIPDSIPAGVWGRERIAAGIEAATLLGRTASLQDVGAVAAFAASDRARSITAASINISAGTFFD